jgi:hypothetical protein
MLSKNIWLGVGVGALLAFISDPWAGRRRRAIARDKLVRAGRKTRGALDATARDLANRTAGVVAATRGRMSSEPVDDRRLVERVRAKLGRACSHPRAIEVSASDGIVTLRGLILASELDHVLGAVGSVRGVVGVNNELEPRESAEGVPELQGEGNVAEPLEVHPRRWPPAKHALVTAGVAATGLCIAAYARR